MQPKRETKSECSVLVISHPFLVTFWSGFGPDFVLISHNLKRQKQMNYDFCFNILS